MKKRTRKATAVWITLSVLIGFFVVASVTNQLSTVGQIIVLMAVGNAPVYIDGAVANGWQKSKYFRPELAEK